MNAGHAKHAGASITEFMIAMSLGAILIAAVTGIFISNKSNFNMQQGLMRLQENGRYTDFLLSEKIRMASFQGCSNQNLVSINNLISSPPATVNLSNSIVGYQGGTSAWTPNLPSELSGAPKAGTDVLEIRMAAEPGTTLSSNMSSTNATIDVVNRISIQPGEFLLITDCETGDIFESSAGTSSTAITHTATDNTSSNLSKAYQTDAQVFKFEYYAFYIKDSGRSNATGLPIFALFQRDANGNETELVEGVEEMRITYGVDTTGDGSADTFDTAAAVETASQWPQVVSVDISLLLNSINEVEVKPQQYTFQGTTITPSDNMLRRQWDNYVTIRNRSV